MIDTTQGRADPLSSSYIQIYAWKNWPSERKFCHVGICNRWTFEDCQLEEEPATAKDDLRQGQGQTPSQVLYLLWGIQRISESLSPLGSSGGGIPVCCCSAAQPELSQEWSGQSIYLDAEFSGWILDYKHT